MQQHVFSFSVWAQVDLLTWTSIGGIIIQDRGEGGQYVTGLQVHYSEDGQNWEKATKGGLIVRCSSVLY